MITALGQQILRTDTAGMPLEWIDYRSAVRFHFLEQIAYVAGNPLFQIHGGINAVTRQQSVVQVHSIIATHGNSHAIQKMRKGYIPPLNNPALFRRDSHLCLYCGETFHVSDLSRDHEPAALLAAMRDRLRDLYETAARQRGVMGTRTTLLIWSFRATIFRRIR